MKKSTFIVKGMSCEHCKATIEGAVKALSGVQSADADLGSKRVLVEHEEARTDQSIRDSIEAAGYSVS